MKELKNLNLDAVSKKDTGDAFHRPLYYVDAHQGLAVDTNQKHEAYNSFAPLLGPYSSAKWLMRPT